MDLTIAQLQTMLFVLAATVLSLIGAYFYQKKKNIHETPKEWIVVAKVSKLFIYPLKSGRRLEISTGECTDVGLMAEYQQDIFQLRDRSFVVYSEKTREFKSAVTCPKLVLIESSVPDKDHIVFSVENERPLHVKIPKRSERNVTEISLYFGEKIASLDCGDEAASWFSRYLLDKPYGLRLGYHDGSFKRDIGQVHANKLFKIYDKLRNDAGGMYSNLTSYSLINHAAIEALNAQSPEPVNVNFYRPNVYVETEQFRSFSEESWDWIKIGDAVFRNVKPCTRCALTNINPENGVSSQKREPLRTLERINTLKDPVHIAGEGKRGVMGIQMTLKIPGKMCVGDDVFAGITED